MAGGKEQKLVIIIMMVMMMGVHPLPINSTGSDNAESGSGSAEDDIIGDLIDPFVRDILIGIFSFIGGVIILIFIIIPTAYLCYRRIRPDKEFRDRKKRDKARAEQETKEEEQVKGLVVDYLERNKKDYTYDQRDFKMKDLGCRLQRQWFRIESTDTTPLMLSIAPVSKRCAIVLNNKTIATLDKIFEFFKTENYSEVHLIRKIDYVYSTESKRGYAIIIQDWSSEGSLRDCLHKLKVETSWTQYKERSEPLEIAKVKAFGRQILTGLLRLYKQDIVPLGHLHTGNIFVGESQVASGGNQDEATEITRAAEGDAGHKVCRVGGYENMLLGYRTRLYSQLVKHNISTRLIDVYLFGHVLYEMALGQTLEAAIPTKEERDVTYKPAEPAGTEKEMVATNCFAAAKSPKHTSTEWIKQLNVSDDGYRSTIESELTEVLDYIFDSEKPKPSSPTDAILKILNMEFFKSSEKLNIKTNRNLKGDKVKKLLQKVKAGEPAEQPVVVESVNQVAIDIDG